MDGNASANQANEKPDLASRIRRRILQVVVQFLLLAALLFVSSGRLNWVWAFAAHQDRFWTAPAIWPGY